MKHPAATFSPCRRYRYTLWREWDVEMQLEGSNDGERGSDQLRQFLMVIGLNPSTADETKDDPTIRKCIGFAKRWGFGGLMMTNLFAWRDTDPAKMKKAAEPVGDDNLATLAQYASQAGMILAAWGKHGKHHAQDEAVLHAISGRVYHLKLNSDRTPMHPLYVPYETVPEIYAFCPQPFPTAPSDLQQP